MIEFASLTLLHQLYQLAEVLNQNLQRADLVPEAYLADVMDVAVLVYLCLLYTSDAADE